MRNLKFRKREITTKIVVIITNTGCAEYDDYYKKCRRRGDFDANVHFFVDSNGTIHNARPDDCVGSWRYDDGETSVHIMAQSEDGKLSGSQRHSLIPLLVYLTHKYPDAEVEERTE